MKWVMFVLRYLSNEYFFYKGNFFWSMISVLCQCNSYMSSPPSSTNKGRSWDSQLCVF